jgi:hypothetical protein
MTLPALLLGLLISTLYGALFHLVRGGGASRLLLYLILGWAGFWAGQWLADQLDLTFASLGQIHLGLATLFSLGSLVLGSWLVRTEPGKKSPVRSR